MIGMVCLIGCVGFYQLLVLFALLVDTKAAQPLAPGALTAGPLSKSLDGKSLCLNDAPQN